MNALETKEITRYLLGQVTDDQRKKLDSRISADTEFAAAVDIERFIIQGMSGVSVDSRENLPVRLPSVKKMSQGWNRRLGWTIATAASLLLIASTVVAAKALFNDEIFRDSFRSKAFNLDVWKRQPAVIQERGGGIRPDSGFVRLVNRGYLEPKMDFPEAISIEFEWQWYLLGLDPDYSDHLTVGLRTHAVPNPEQFCEISDGLVIKFDARSHAISISDNSRLPLAVTDVNAVKMPYEEWLKVKVTDDGYRICVFADGPEVGGRSDGSPLLVYERKRNASDGHKIVIYNRELVGFPHVSGIRDFVVRKFSSRDE